MPRSPWRSAALGCLLAGSLAASLTGCSLGNAASGAPTTTLPPVVTPATTPTTLPRATTTTSTTVAIPSKPQSSDDEAALVLMDAWGAGNQAEAATVATPAAVAETFANQYPVNNLQGRGCTDVANPATCTYRNTLNGDLYEIQVTQTPAGGWYVIQVITET